MLEHALDILGSTQMQMQAFQLVPQQTRLETGLIELVLGALLVLAQVSAEVHGLRRQGQLRPLRLVGTGITHRLLRKPRCIKSTEAEVKAREGVFTFFATLISSWISGQKRCGPVEL